MGDLRGSDVAFVRAQLDREPTIPFDVVARCSGGHPLVIRNRPTDAQGRPFPTLFWLTCPDAVKAVARLESEGWIARLNERVATEPAFARALADAHVSYAHERGRTDPAAEALGGVGGTRRGLKCLHAHYAHHVAGGPDPVGAWVAERIEPIHVGSVVGRVAVVDLGTNSIRLLVASLRSHTSLEEFARDMVITRIGQGVDATGRLDPDALARTVDVLAWYCGRARALEAERIGVTATSAVRDASNRDELETAVLRHAGSALRVIPGEREAELSFDGATRGLDAPPPFLVIDIGGGSTELVVGGTEPVAAVSLRLGSVRMTERFVRTDPPAGAELHQMREDIRARLADADSALASEVRPATMVAVAGTTTTVQGMALDLPRYDRDAIHRTWLSLSDARIVLGRLRAMTNAERTAIPVMPPGRGDVIVAGAEILVEAMQRFGFERVLVSETDILDGLAFELLETR